MGFGFGLGLGLGLGLGFAMVSTNRAIVSIATVRVSVV